MYDDFYSLTGRPFQLTPDPEFYFHSHTHRKALSYLGYGLAQGEGFIVITGEVGAGKSTLAAHLLATLDRHRLTPALIVTGALDGEELIQLAARAFGIDAVEPGPAAKALALGRIEHFLHEEARAGRRCLLVVDEAQTLAISALEELRMLSNFQLGAQPLLQIVLLGQPEFRTLLQTSPELEQLRQRVIAAHHLEAMDADEVGAYVEHRLARAGWQGRPGFDPAIFVALARASGGIPRRINQILNRLLLLGAVEQRDHIDLHQFDAVIDDFGREPISPANGPPPPPSSPPPSSPPPSSPPSSSAPAPGCADPAVTPMAPAPETGWPVPETGRDATIDAAWAPRIDALDQALAALAARIDQAGAASWRDDALETGLAAAAARIAHLETRLTEQEQAIRHVLTMLIEWFETHTPPPALVRA